MRPLFASHAFSLGTPPALRKRVNYITQCPKHTGLLTFRFNHWPDCSMQIDSQQILPGIKTMSHDLGIVNAIQKIMILMNGPGRL